MNWKCIGDTKWEMKNDGVHYLIGVTVDGLFSATKFKPADLKSDKPLPLPPVSPLFKTLEQAKVWCEDGSLKNRAFNGDDCSVFKNKREVVVNGSGLCWIACWAESTQVQTPFREWFKDRATAEVYANFLCEQDKPT